MLKLNRKILSDAMLIVIGAFIVAFAYSAFCLPYNITPGGVYGITIALNEVTKGFLGFADGLPIGTAALFMNVPLFLLATKRLGLASGGKTIASFILIAVFSDLIAAYLGDFRFIKEDTILASFYGGALMGLGVSMVFKANGTCAGTDVLARVITKGSNMKLSTMIIAIDSFVVLLGLLAFRDWAVPLYSWITIFVYGKVIDAFQPENPNKALFIVSECPDELRDAIVEKLQMRGTFLHGNGMYAGAPRRVIFMNVERKDMPRVKKLVLSIDPKAFITSTVATNDTIKPHEA